MEKRRLSHHKYAQCHVIVLKDGSIHFISYNTLVIRAELTVHGEYVLFCSGTYTQTTRRQIGWFLKEYFGDISYYDMKQCAEDGTGIQATLKHARFW